MKQRFAGGSFFRSILVIFMIVGLTGGVAGVAQARPASVASQSVSADVGVEPRLWGVIVHLDREVGCWAATGLPQLELAIMAAVPSPFNVLVVAAIKLHKAWIGSRMGSNGVDLHISWAGFIHWVEPRGDLQAC